MESLRRAVAAMGALGVGYAVRRQEMGAGLSDLAMGCVWDRAIRSSDARWSSVTDNGSAA